MATYNDRNQLLISSASRITGASVSIKNSFGNQLLVPKNSTVPYPQNITLTAIANKYLTPQYSWFYKIGTGEYTSLNLSTSVITLNLDAAWLTAVGANTTVTYKVQVTETSGSLGINGTEAEFVVPVLREGTDGTSAWNNIIVRIYRRSTTNAAPSIDRSASQTSTYTFSNGSLVGAPLGWSTSIPETGGDYIFVSEYSAVSQLTSVQFTNDNWSVPVLYVKSGNVGSSGIVVYAYKRSGTVLPSTDKPTNSVTYSFATNTITTEDLGGGWSKSIPTGTDPLYIVAATASSSEQTDTIPTTEWSSPVEFVRNGTSGTSPVVGLLTNESTTVAADVDGTVKASSFDGAGGVFKVFEGLTDKTGNGVTYSVVAGTASGVTISIDATGTYTVSAMSADTGTATLRAVYAGVTVDKVYSIAKSKAGAIGSAAITAILSNENHVFTADKDGAIAAGSYGGSGTQVRVYEGSTELTYDAVGTTNGTWKVTASATSITAGAIADSGVYATVGNASGMSSSLNTASITYTITGKSLTGTSFSIVKTQTFSKSKAGINGTSPTIHKIALSAPVITKDSEDAATAGSYSSVTIQGTYTTGSIVANFGYITVTADNDAEATTAINTAVTPYLLAPATTAGTSKYTIKLYDTDTVATATLLDTQVINVVFKGADGAPSKYVNLTTTAQAFAYNSEGATPNPGTATFTATAYNTTGTVYYEFLVGATSKANTTTNTYTYTPQSAYSSMPEQITVKVREGSTAGTVVATDTMSVIGIKPGATGNTVAVPYLYARNNSVSSAPAFTTTNLSTLTFTFASGTLSGTPPTNWYKEPPDVSTGSVLWVRTAVAFSSDATYSIPWTSWGDPKVLSTSGVRGSRNLYSNNAAYISTYQPNPNLTAGLENYREKATQLIADATSGSIPTTPIKGDTVTFTNGTTYVFTLTYDGSAWNPPGTVIDGNLLVTGSVTAAKINSNGLTVRDPDGGTILEAKTDTEASYVGVATLRSTSYTQGSGTTTGSGWRIDKAGNAVFENAIIRGTVYASEGQFSGSLRGANIEGTTGTFTGILSASSLLQSNKVGTSKEYFGTYIGNPGSVWNTFTIATTANAYLQKEFDIVNTDKVLIKLWAGGGGGGGGGTNINGTGGSGGGSGGYTEVTATLTNNVLYVISAATNASPCVITTTNNHNLSTGDRVTFLTMPNGFSQLNNTFFWVEKLTNTTFRIYSDSSRLVPVNSSSWGSYTGGGELWPRVDSFNLVVGAGGSGAASHWASGIEGGGTYIQHFKNGSGTPFATYSAAGGGGGGAPGGGGGSGGSGATVSGYAGETATSDPGGRGANAVFGVGVGGAGGSGFGSGGSSATPYAAGGGGAYRKASTGGAGSPGKASVEYYSSAVAVSRSEFADLIAQLQAKLGFIYTPYPYV